MAEFVTILFLMVLFITLWGLIFPRIFFWNKEGGRKAVLKQGGLATLALFVLMAILMPKGDQTDIESAPAKKDVISSQAEAFQHAKVYEIISNEDSSFPGRKRLGISILSEAASFEERAQTAMKAAIDYQKITKADLVSVRLEPSKAMDGKGSPLAVADYAPDGKGISGDTSMSGNDWVWKVEAIKGTYIKDAGVTLEKYEVKL